MTWKYTLFGNDRKSFIEMNQNKITRILKIQNTVGGTLYYKNNIVFGKILSFYLINECFLFFPITLGFPLKNRFI